MLGEIIEIRFDLMRISHQKVGDFFDFKLLCLMEHKISIFLCFVKHKNFSFIVRGKGTDEHHDRLCQLS